MSKHMMKFLCLILLISTSVRAQNLHLQLPQKAHEILKPKASAISLTEVQKKVVNDQIDLQISFEKLLQAQKKISEARAQFFPYGAGTVAAMYFLNIWNPLILVELITSIPAKVFAVQSEKNLARAQYYSNEALRENIKNQIAHLYFNILKEESALKISQIEISLLESLMQVYNERIEMGLSTEDDLRSIKLRLLNLRDAYLRFSSYLNLEKAAFNTMIAKTSAETQNYELQTVPTTLDSEQYNLEVNALVEAAVKNSPELVAAKYMVTAASKAKKSTKWSILSFNGIGFGYWGRVQVAGSQVNAARLNRQMVEDTLGTQVHVKYNSFNRSLDFLQSEQLVFEDTTHFTEASIEQFKAQDITLDELLETELIYLKDFREMVMAHYDSYIKLNDLERSTLTKMSSAAPGKTQFLVELDHWKRKKYTLAVSGEGIKNAVKVEYFFDEEVGLDDLVSHNTQDNFEIVLKLYQANGISGIANITMKDGQIIKQEFNF